MASTGPIDKYRDTVLARLNEILLVLRTNETPDTVLIDKDFNDINVVHPMLYTDLLKPWKPMGLFPERNLVSDGFPYPILPFTYRSVSDVSSSELHKRLIDATALLIADIGYYMSKEWTAQYRSLLDQYVIARAQWLTDTQTFAYLKGYALASGGDVKKLIDYFGAWLEPTTLNIEQPMNWTQTELALHKAVTTDDVLNEVTIYLLTAIAANNAAHKPIRELPMVTTVKDFGAQIDDYIDDRKEVPEAIAYGGQMAYTYGINLLAAESEVRGKYHHLLGKDICRPDTALTHEQRKKTLCVVTSPLRIDFLWEAALKNLPTLVFVLED